MELLDAGAIEKSTGPWAAPVVMVPKKGGEWRMCVDYRALNQVTKKDAYPLPLIDSLIRMFDGCLYFSTLDLKSGYHQVRMFDQDREKTAFVTPFGLHQYIVMPFGLCNAPATFNDSWTICSRAGLGKGLQSTSRRYRHLCRHSTEAR